MFYLLIHPDEDGVLFTIFKTKAELDEHFYGLNVNFFNEKDFIKYARGVQYWNDDDNGRQYTLLACDTICPQKEVVTKFVF